MLNFSFSIATKIIDSMERRKKILIDKTFQIRLTVYIVIFSVLVSILLGSIAYLYDNLFHVYFNATDGHMMSELVKKLTTFNPESFVRTIIFIICFSLFITLFGLRQSHRIAGPIQKIRSALLSISENRFDREIAFREQDYFPMLAKDLNNTLKTLKSKKKDSLNLLHDILLALQDIKNNFIDDRKTTEKIEELIEKTEKAVKLYSS